MTARLNNLKLALFLAVAVLTAGLMISVLGEQTDPPGERGELTAVFADASYLSRGDQVRIAGVPVGKVYGVELRQDNSVAVRFGVTTQQPLPVDSQAAVRYKDLLGGRYLEIIPGSDQTQVLRTGATIPESQTSPAVDLDLLTGGFKPLFRALDSEQINLLSSTLIQVFEGQAGAVHEMLTSVGSFTGNLADNDQVIGELIDNLNAVLATVDDRHDELDQSIVSLQELVSGLEKQRDTIARSVTSIEQASTSIGALVERARPPIRDDIAHLHTISESLNARSGDVEKTLAAAGPALDLLSGIGVYGDFFNFYLCDLRVRFTGPDGTPVYTPWVNSDVERCNGRPVDR